MKQGFNWQGKDKKVKGIMRKTLILSGNEAKNHFVGSFRKQGFTDSILKKWKPRKKDSRRDRGRAILVKSGDLRRSIKRRTPNMGRLSINIESDLPYSRVHNEGIGKMPKREFIGESKQLNAKVNKIIVDNLDKLF